MLPLELSINRLARDLDVPPNRISAIVNGKRAITADSALRLGTYFRMSPETWLTLQAEYDLRVAQREHGDNDSPSTPPESLPASAPSISLA